MNAREPMVIHYVKHMDKAINFYRQVFEVSVLSESPGWSELNFETFKLALHGLHEGMDEGPIPHAGLNLLVDSIEYMQDRIEQQGGQLIELQEPTDFVPVRVARFEDCEGNGFELRQYP